jgi:hypothetical protein
MWKMDELRETLESAEANAAAALTCLSCKTAKAFKGHPTLKEAMVQIDDFRSTHRDCSAD